MAEGITIHEGYNDLGELFYDITPVEQSESIQSPVPNAGPPVSRKLLFEFKFDPSGNPVPSDYDVKFDLPHLNDTSEITGELIARGGKQTFSYTLASNPIKAGSLSITDGIESFVDNGDGTLRGSDGGTGTVNYATGTGSVTFFVPPMDGDNITANYKKHQSVSDEDKGATTGASSYSFTLAQTDIVPGTAAITCGTATFADSGSGVLSGSTGGSGTINYDTGAIVLTGLSPDLTGEFLASYTYWKNTGPETIGTGALSYDYNFKLVHHPIVPGSLTITDGSETFTDGGTGTLSSSLGGGGTIDYTTGAGTLSCLTEPDWGTEFLATYTTDNVMLDKHTNGEGYISIDVPVYPVVKLNSTGSTNIDFDVVGTLENRQDELYLSVDDGSGLGTTYYTLITDMVVKDGYLKIFNGTDTYYPVYPYVAVTSDVTLLKITKKGDVSVYHGSEGTWEDLGSLTFSSIQHPDKLDIVSDGFYSTNTATGTITTGHLGDTSTVFENFKGVLNNPDPTPVNVAVSVFEPDAAMPVKMADFTDLTPGDVNIHIVKVTADPYVAPDVTPTLSDIESITGVGFSTDFRSFLSSKGIGTIDSARQAGPISYIEGIPGTLDPSEVSLLQSHVDLYSLNANSSQNQFLINSGFGDIYSIANTPKDVFLNAVVGSEMPLFQAAQIHETGVQNLKLVGNLIAGTLTDLKLANPSGQSVSVSSFVASLTNSTNSCGCDECKSGVSPFAYLMDLMKYAALHISHTLAPLYSPGSSPTNYNSFSNLISDQFLQPFGSLNATCENLHTEYCRVRLVTEVLEKIVQRNEADFPPITPPSGVQQTTLAKERNQFLLLVYKTILKQAGTSIEELRDIVTMNPVGEKIKAAQKLADKLGIPLYDSYPYFTADRMWLTFGNPNPSHVLNAGNLEAVFGFRNTQRDVLTNTPISIMEQWRSDYLKDVWKKEDYTFTDYSREDVVPGTDATFKANWKPIVDPDIIGWSDFTYLNDDTNYPIANYPKSTFLRSLWKRRKEDTDNFLQFCLTDAANINTISADINGRILKVTDRNIVNHVFDNGEIQIQDPVTSSWTTFNVLGKKQNGTDTDIVLKKSTNANPQPAMFYPKTPTPTMRYRRSVNVVTSMTAGTITFTLTWPDNVIQDRVTGTNAYAKLISTGSAAIYQTSDSSLAINSISSNSVNLTITGGAGEPLADFCGGSIQFVYKAEVPLYSVEVMEPRGSAAGLCYELFQTGGQSYSLLSAITGFSNPFPYTVWQDPTSAVPPDSWPIGVTGSTYYEKLKQIFQFLATGSSINELNNFVSEYLHLSVSAFNRMMTLFTAHENYLLGMYTVPPLTTEELYELVSIVRTSGRTQLRDVWVKEEIRHSISGSPAKLMLSGQYFWKALNEPIAGSWDPSLQTVTSNIPILDPELIDREDILINPEANPYRVLHDQRESELLAQSNEFIGYLIPFDVKGFNKIFNKIYNGNIGATPYNPTYTAAISPYSTLQDIQNAVNNSDVFIQKQASEILWSVFKLSTDDFLSILKVLNLYDLNDPASLPSNMELLKVVGLLTSAYKRNRLYPSRPSDTPPFAGWIDEELTGSATFTTYPVNYYDVLYMKMAPGRSSAQDRLEWQQTLAAWNRQPIIQPDIVPPENIIDFIPSNWVYSTWNSRNSTLLTAAGPTGLSSYISSSFAANVLFTNFKAQLDLAFARVDFNYFTPFGSNNYLPYFTELKDKENSGEDIRLILEQLGITVTEYRFLRHVFDVLENDVANSPGAPSSLISSEIQDTIDIIIAIRSRNLSFDLVLEEYNHNPSLILDQDYFQIFKPFPVNFPANDLTVSNQWRSPYSLRKAWTDKLQTRIDRERGVIEKWANVLMEAETRNMPLLRDALIRSLALSCETFPNTAERIAKSYLIETKDNCCVKHTRASFAIETLQSFVFTLSNGIYANFNSDYTFTAPNFEKEWLWLGSYNSWRSAIFVFLYPENLLYPTLKRSQSPAFTVLANKLASANTFSPDDACKAAKEFQSYLDDITNLEVVCSTSAFEISNSPNTQDCCGGSTQQKWMTYFFGNGQSGQTYWSYKQTDSNDSEAHSFWMPLPIERDSAKLIGCFVLGSRSDGWTSRPLSLFLFYTYYEAGVLKMAYINRNLLDPNAKWLPEKSVDLPKYEGTDFTPFHATACQDKFEHLDHDLPGFIFSYNITTDFEQVFYLWDYANNTFDDFTNAERPIFSRNDPPMTAIRHQVLSGNGATMDFVTYVYPDQLAICSWSGNAQDVCIYTVDNGANMETIGKMIGAFESVVEPNTIIYVFREYLLGNSLGNIYAVKASLNWDYVTANNPLSGVTILNPVLTNLTIGNEIGDLKEIYPIFYMSNFPLNYAMSKDSGTLISSDILVPLSPQINLDVPVALAPEKIPVIQIESAECASDLNLRRVNIKNKLQANINIPEGTAVASIIRTKSVRELLYEAYYFVPLLLAIDQQSRGQFFAALAWYRSIYDYTKNGTNRKIFYGLVLEEAIQNSNLQLPGWLLDPLNPHLIARTRTNAYTRYTLMNIIQCMFGLADREFTLDTIETVPIARKLYSEALDLLKTNELNFNENQCATSSVACLNFQTSNYSVTGWNNLYGQLQGSLNSLGNVSLIGSLTSGIADSLNGGNESTYAAIFAGAFETVAAATPATPSPQSVVTVLNGFAESVNNAARYVFANTSPADYNQTVGTAYAGAVASISGLNVSSVGDPANEGHLSWLMNTVPNNTTPYQFSYASPDGVQNLPGGLSFNPTIPTQTAYVANINFGNAPFLHGHQPIGVPAEYCPIIDYRFCTPQNPIYDSLMLKGNLELYKIFNCRNIAGMVRDLDIYTAPNDNSTGIPVIGGSGNLVLPGTSNFAPSQYRFKVLVERAKQIAEQAQQMESLFLASLEKADAESYNQLRAKQDLETAKATIRLQDLRITQANDEKAVSTLQLNKVTYSQNYFNNLISAGLNNFEIQSINLLNTSINYLFNSGLVQQINAEAFAALTVLDPFAIATAAGSAAGSLSTFASQYSTMASLASQMSSYVRRQQEWEYQSQLAGFDISIANQQIKVADDNIRIVSQERAIAQLNSDHAQAALDFLQNKFTNAELYNWMSNVLERSYSYMLNLSTSIARTAESQLYFERQEQAGPFILNDYWTTPSSGFSSISSGNSIDRRGLTGSARLMVDITRLDQYAFDTNKRKLQMSKIVSLAQNFPVEFQAFKETGVMNFQLTNKFFDYDFPGHYLRLINGMKTTVVGLLPVYDNIKATLTADTISYTVVGGTSFQKVPIRRLELDSVALTGSNNATGMFDMQQAQGELLNPFEGMGIESRWEFKMPQFTNRFDFGNIADILITVDYTAFDNYEYRTQVLQDLENELQFNRGFSLKNNFPDQWYNLASAEAGPQNFGVIFELKREMFPQGIDNLRLDGSDLVLYFVRKDGYTSEISVLDFSKVQVPDNTNYISGDTIDAKLPTTQMTTTLSDNPLNKLRLLFDNNPTNRSLFSDGNITDILLIVGCKADLKNYPL